MANVHSKATEVFVNGYPLTLFLNKVAFPGEVDTAETSTFGRNSKTRVAGLKDVKATAEGLFSAIKVAPQNEVDDVFSAALGVELTKWLYCPEGDAYGKRCTMMQGIASSYEVASDIGDAVSVKAEAEADAYGPEYGIVLHSTDNVESAASNSAATDNGAATTAGLAAQIQVVGMTGTSPTLTAKVQHSVDNSVWVDLVTFTAISAATGGAAACQRGEVAGTVNRYLRSIWTITGTGGPTFTFVIGAARK